MWLYLKSFYSYHLKPVRYKFNLPSKQLQIFKYHFHATNLSLIVMFCTRSRNTLDPYWEKGPVNSPMGGLPLPSDPNLLARCLQSKATSPRDLGLSKTGSFWLPVKGRVLLIERNAASGKEIANVQSKLCCVQVSNYFSIKFCA